MRFTGCYAHKLLSLTRLEKRSIAPTRIARFARDPARILRKLSVGTKQRLTGSTHLRQGGDDVLRMFATGGPAARQESLSR
jgi:hypothetical protein